MYEAAFRAEAADVHRVEFLEIVVLVRRFVMAHRPQQQQTGHDIDHLLKGFDKMFEDAATWQILCSNVNALIMTSQSVQNLTSFQNNSNLNS